MSIIPVLEVGLRNAWILILPQILIAALSDMILKERGTYESKEELARHTIRERRVSRTASFLLFFTIIYSVFLPLSESTAWFYVGLSVYLLGIILQIMASVAFATTPVVRPAITGAYRISRHPMNFGVILVLIGIGIASLSWVYLLCGAVFMILMSIWLPSEERWCLETYGNAYREYKNRTPMWIGLPKSRE